MLLIRTDANKQVGLGHLMRCLTIAEAAKRAGIETLFLLAEETAKELLGERGMGCVILHTDFSDMEGELPVLFQTIKGLTAAKKEDVKDGTGSKTVRSKGISNKTALLVDSYRITVPYMQELKKGLENICGAELLLLEDYGDPSYPADTVINYNIYGPDFSYGGTAGRALLGCRYMPLRKEFTMQPYGIREKFRSVLITTGGSDPCRIAPELAKRLGKEENVTLHVVCGRFSESRKELLDMEKNCENMKVYSDVKQMWELMADCDAAVSAAGTTLYELCAMGIPTLCFSFAPNQILPGKTFGEKTAMTYAGDYQKDKEAMFQRIEEGIRELMGMSGEEREKISENLRGITDGRGAERIIEAVFKEAVHEKEGNEL